MLKILFIFYVAGTYVDLAELASHFHNLLEDFNTIKEEKEVEKIIKHLSITSTAFNSMIDIEGRKVSTSLRAVLICVYVHICLY